MPRKAKTASGSELGKRVGRNIRNARKQLGITQSQLAEAMSVETLTISRVETGVQMPSLERLADFSKVLQTSLRTLVSDANEDDAFALMLADVLKDLPQREKQFVYDFAVSYVQHWKAGKKK